MCMCVCANVPQGVHELCHCVVPTRYLCKQWHGQLEARNTNGYMISTLKHAFRMHQLTVYVRICVGQCLCVVSRCDDDDFGTTLTAARCAVFAVCVCVCARSRM